MSPAPGRFGCPSAATPGLTSRPTSHSTAQAPAARARCLHTAHRYCSTTKRTPWPGQYCQTWRPLCGLRARCACGMKFCSCFVSSSGKVQASLWLGLLKFSCAVVMARDLLCKCISRVRMMACVQLRGTSAGVICGRGDELGGLCRDSKAATCNCIL